MNRIITILVTIFILLLLYIWISHVWGSDSPRHPKQIVHTTADGALGTDDTSADEDTSLITDQMMDQLVDDENPSASEETQPMTEQKQEVAEEEPVKQEPVKVEPVKTETPKKALTVEKKAVVKTEPKAKPIAPPTPPATKTSQPISSPISESSAHEGKHLVIAGNFLQMENATQRMNELKKAGFKDVEVVNFDLSEYHTVCAGRFDDVNEARRLVKKLKDYHKIDAYVRIGS